MLTQQLKLIVQIGILLIIIYQSTILIGLPLIQIAVNGNQSIHLLIQIVLSMIQITLLQTAIVLIGLLFTLLIMVLVGDIQP